MTIAAAMATTHSLPAHRVPCGAAADADCVSVNCDIITHGKDSIPASSRQGWFDYMFLLLTNADLRRSIDARHTLGATTQTI